ncbi:MAG: acetate kinase [Clostridia bacterium]|nr:acetate kinase [Clostridia bacterium]
MKILVINAGSSSLKYQLLDMETESVLAKGLCDRIGIEGSMLKHKKAGCDEVVIMKNMPSHTEAIAMVLDALVNAEYGVVSSMEEIGAVGHRMVHSGEDFNCSVLVNDEVMAICKNNTELAPLHQPANILGVEACRAVMPGVPMALVFDTAFHSTMPEKAYLYGIPYEAYKDYKVRRYGFHGASHMFVSQEAAKFLGKDVKDLKIVTCHLGNGSSITAVDGGKSVDTSMGFTPLEGVPMGTRSGDLDPAVLEYLMGKYNMNISEMLNYLNKKSGMAGVSGVSSDFRDLCAAAEAGNERAKLALDVFSYRVKKYVGAYAAAMDGLDVLVFTAGVGENTVEVREAVAGELTFFGVELDRELNANGVRGIIREISTPASKVRVLIVPTNEELVIARETLALL